jgi:hypothetical protein
MDDSLFRQVMGPTLAPRGPKGKVKGKGNKQFEPAVPVQQVSNRGLTEENALLVQLLQQAKAEREQLLMDVATLKKRVLEKEIEGFGELFRWISFQKIGTSTIQSRAMGGVAGGTYLFALPGSTGACKDGWDEMLRFQLDSRHRPCNLVELMPRLLEHLKPA